MPAPIHRRQRQGNRNRYTSHREGRSENFTDRYGNPVRSRTPRGNPTMTDNERRMDEVSRNLVRLLRHAPKRREAAFPADLATGASIALSTVVQHPTFTPFNVTVEELAELAHRDVPENKMRYDPYTGPDGEQRIRVFNGHSLEGVVLPARDRTSELCSQRYISHGTSLQAAHSISLEGFRLTGQRADHHFIDATYTARQYQYVKSGNRSKVWIVLDVHAAESLGCSFTKLPNEVIVPKGANGHIPREAIVSYWPNSRRYLDADAIQASPPQAIPIPAPEGAIAPAHTDDDPQADHLVPLSSDVDGRSSRNSSPPANQTKLDTRSLSRTATSKSAPSTPILAAQSAPQDRQRSKTPTPTVIVSAPKRDVAPTRAVPSDTRGILANNVSLPLTAVRERDDTEGVPTAIRPSGRSHRRERRGRSGRRKSRSHSNRHRRRSRSLRDVAPKLRPRTAPSPRNKPPPYQNDTVLPSFANVKQLQDYIQIAVQAETAKALSTTQTKVSRYGPPALTQNAETLAAEEHTHRAVQLPQKGQETRRMMKIIPRIRSINYPRWNRVSLKLFTSTEIFAKGRSHRSQRKNIEKPTPTGREPCKKHTRIE